MTQSTNILTAGEALAGAVFTAYHDAAFATLKNRLYNIHAQLTSQMSLVRSHRPFVDAAPAAKAQKAVTSCNSAAQALSAAATPTQRTQAVNAGLFAVDAVNAVLPPLAQAIV
jgi:hypothetical protein